MRARRPNDWVIIRFSPLWMAGVVGVGTGCGYIRAAMGLSHRQYSGASRREGAGCLSLFTFGLLLATGIGLLHHFFSEIILKVIDARDWAATACVILDSEVKDLVKEHAREVESKGGDPQSVPVEGYRPEVRYAYHVNGQRHISARIWFSRSTADTKHDVEAIVARYPKGSQQTCYVDPADPAYAVLERGFKPQLLVALLPLGLVLVGLVGLSLRFLANRRVAADEREADFRIAHTPQTTGALTIRGKSGLGALLVITLFTMVWNVGVAFLGREVIDSWRDGPPVCHGWFLTVIATPFVVVGLVLVVLVFYSILKLFNPRPTITLSSGTVPLGGTVELSWRFSGRYERLRRLRINLDGRQEATYGRGRNRVTASEVFRTVVLVDTTRAAEMREGRVTVAAPADTHPTWSSAHNGIAWAVRLIGEIHRWPNVVEEFEITVVPAQTPVAAEGRA